MCLCGVPEGPCLRYETLLLRHNARGVLFVHPGFNNCAGVEGEGGLKET